MAEARPAGFRLKACVACGIHAEREDHLRVYVPAVRDGDGTAFRFTICVRCLRAATDKGGGNEWAAAFHERGVSR